MSKAFHRISQLPNYFGFAFKKDSLSESGTGLIAKKPWCYEILPYLCDAKQGVCHFAAKFQWCEAFNNPARS